MANKASVLTPPWGERVSSSRARPCEPDVGTVTFRLADCRRYGEIAVLSVNDPPANTLTYDFVSQLENEFFELSRDPTVRAVVLSGAGERFFSGGVNIGMLRSVTPRFNSNFILFAAEVFDFINCSPLLVVAAINGHVTGGGLELALIAKKRVAVAGSYNFGFPEVKLGVIPGLGGTQRLSRIVGVHKALELITHGDFISVQEAQALGIVDAVLPNDDFLKRAIDYTRALLSDLPPKPRAETPTNPWIQPDQAMARYERQGRIGVITVSDACAKVSGIAALWALNQAILDARQDDCVEAILLIGKDGALQLGAGQEPDDETWAYAEHVFRRLEGFPRICALAMVDVVGVLATELALACDYRLVPDGADAGGEGFSVAARSHRRMRFSPNLPEGANLTINEALARGLARAVDHSSWPQSAINWLGRFVSPRGASMSIGYAKFAVVQGASLSPDAGMLLERHLQEQLFRSRDASEGMKAYLEKRSTTFRGE